MSVWRLTSAEESNAPQSWRGAAGSSGAVGARAAAALLLLPFHLLPPRVIFGSLAPFFPVLKVPRLTVILAVALSALVAAVSSLVPLYELRRLRINDGLRKLT